MKLINTKDCTVKLIRIVEKQIKDACSHFIGEEVDGTKIKELQDTISLWFQAAVDECQGNCESSPERGGCLFCGGHCSTGFCDLGQSGFYTVPTNK